jgi:hypothetical protein
MRSIINLAIKQVKLVMPDVIRHPVYFWIPAFAGMTALGINRRTKKVLV